MKKFPAIHQKAAFNEIYLKGGRPLQVYKKHAGKVLTKHPVLVIHALTAAIDKAIELHLWLMEEFPYLSAEVQTDSVPTLVELKGEPRLVERSAIHITLRKEQ